MELIQAQNLTLGYPGKIIQENLSFTIEKGDYVFITGENGAGKSTLMKTLLGFTKPLSGKITSSPELKKNSIGYLPQQNGIQKEFPASVREIVLSGFQNKTGILPFYTKKQKDLALKKMEELEIENLKSCSFKELSGGQQQRVLLARALCAADSLLFLDEPVKGFDSIIREKMYSLISELNGKGLTVIMISHDIEASEKYASKIIHLKQLRKEL